MLSLFLSLSEAPRSMVLAKARGTEIPQERRPLKSSLLSQEGGGVAQRLTQECNLREL